MEAHQAEEVFNSVKGLARDPVKYFAAPKNQELGIPKSIRKPFTNYHLPFIQ
jgi:hypothetical protein